MFESTKALCDSYLEMGVPGFDLMICHKGQCVLRYMGGYSDRENKIPMKGDELYNIYSCSKPITVVAAMQLWEKGLFDLEDNLSKYFPEYATMQVATEDGIVPAQKPIQIRELFHMVAGFNYNLHSPKLEQLRIDTNGKCPTREVARALAEEPLSNQPGDKYVYSLGHDVLAALVEHISGQPFAEYVKEHIFDPLGMTNSSFLLPMEEYSRVVPLYNGASGEVKLSASNIPVYRLGTEHASGGAGCASTVEDYMKFLEALRAGEKLIKRSTLEKILTTQITEHQARTYPRKDYGYGLGFRVPKAGCWPKEFGWGGAAGAHLAIDPSRELSIFFAQHVIAAPNKDIRGQLYLSAVKELTGEEPPQVIITDGGDAPVHN